MRTHQIRRGANALQKFFIDLENDPNDPAPYNLSTATAAELRITREDGTAEVWPLTIISSTSTLVKTRLPIAGYFPLEERIAAVPALTIAEGVLTHLEAFQIQVISPLGNPVSR